MAFLFSDASCTLREMENGQKLMVVDDIKGILKILGSKKFKRMMEIKIHINHPCNCDFQNVWQDIWASEVVAMSYNHAVTSKSL